MIKDTWDKNENASANKKEITILKEHFPACFKEDGSFDIERFKEYLSEDINVVNEGYELKFLGKNYARLLVTLETETVIVPNEEHNQKEENKDSENIYITGDNLDGLKHLLKSYAGKVKCIYIDPPYNTGSDGFVYNDNFNFTVEELTEKLSIDEKQAQRVLDLTKRGSASHSAWLMFMYPRLQLARDLLSDDGVIFISIDDNEQANLKLLCDDIFGAENFVSNVARIAKRTSNKGTHFRPTKDYIFVYSRNIELLSEFGIPKDRDIEDYGFVDEDGRRYKKSGASLYQPSLDSRPNQRYYIEAPDGSLIIPPGTVFPEEKKDGEKVKPLSNVDKVWRWSVDTYKKQRHLLMFTEGSSRNPLLDEHGNQSKWNIYPKVYYDEDIKSALLPEDVIYDFPNSQATKELNNLSVPFSFAKPSGLLKHLIKLLGDEKMTVLDFFSGSATTAHATMELNKEDNGNRKYIMVQLPEEIEKGQPAFQKGFRTIDQVGIDRIIKVANKIKEEYPNTNIDLGFKHYTLLEPTTETINKLVEFTPKKNEMIINNTILDEFGVPTVITTWLNNDGYGLTSEAKKLMFAGYETYYKDKHLYLVHPELLNEAIEKIVVKYETDGDFNPENIVLFGYSFTWTELESLKTNLKRLQDTEKNLRINFDLRY